MTDHKVAVVTGASRGMGASLVSAYSNAGFEVIAASRSIGAATDPGVVNVAGDIGDPETADRIVREALSRFGRLDTLVNNAGIYLSKPFTEYTQEDYNSLLSTNVAGFFHLTQRALRVMETQGWGHIVTITAAMAEYPINGAPAGLSSLTKGGLNAATKALAIEYAARGIRVNAVAPGIIQTSMNPQPPRPDLNPVGRVGEISDIVAAVLYLERAPFVTGQISYVDGGQSAGHW